MGEMIITPTPPGLYGATPAGDSRYRRLYEIGRTLNSLQPLNDLLTQIVETAAGLIGARASSLMLIDDAGRDLIFQVAYGEKGALLEGLKVPIDDQSIAGWVARHGEPLIIDDVHQVPFFSGSVDRTVDYETESMVCVPLRTQERVIGVVEVLNKYDGSPFSDDDADLLALLAGIAAIAIVNARLFEDRTRRLHELQRTYRGTMLALSALLDTRDTATAGHSQRVVLFSLRLARALGIRDPERLRYMEYGALLHDVGKIGVSDAVLRKPGSYTPEEYAEMRQHPEIGYAMLKDIDFLQPALPVVRYHHERYDGKGYPAGLCGEAIPQEARIFAVADVFDALTSDRPYHPARSYATARTMIEEGRGTHFDPAVTDAFCTIPEAEWQEMRAHVAARAGYLSEFDTDD